jgi:ribosomal protein L11 methyltransferase
VHREHAELVLAELLELAPSGVEEVELATDLIEYAVYGAPGELPALPDLEAAAGGALVDISTEEIADDWAQRWRSFHRPLVLGDRLTVRPPWEPPGETALDVVIDPGQAFGTGAHATTRLCLELILGDRADRPGGDQPGAIARGAIAPGPGLGRRGGSFVDLGCGSGVLAIVAAKLGWSPVLALDYDPAAVTAARENAIANGVELDVRRFDLRSEQVPEADLVAANVLAPPLLGWAASQRRLPPELILSGLLVTEADRVALAFVARGLRERERRTRGEWAALALQASGVDVCSGRLCGDAPPTRPGQLGQPAKLQEHAPPSG